MPYSVLVDDDNAVIEVVYTGPITTSTRVCAMEDGATLLSAHQYRRVLVDLRDAMPADDAADHGDSSSLRLAYRPPIQESRLAYLTTPEQPFKLLAGNLTTRHPSVQPFHCREAALQWLVDEPDA
ncbi:MAG: hypothetical protein JWL98_965 [Xanthomonadaceae bacterium]|nr:hypothetical protein [Xanthomonadaceae bacterium]